VLDLLNQIDPAHEATIVGIEPPEIYAFKHDYVDLLPHREEEMKQRVDKVWLLDEYLLRSAEFSALRVASMERLVASVRASLTKKIHFHPHCHQRAQGPAPDGLPNGTDATMELLRACGYEVELMDTGCCGMAGTFGYEAEHYELSLKVGELKLFPKIRETLSQPHQNSQANIKAPEKKSNADLGEVSVICLANQAVGIVSSGAACRMQIEQGTGVKAIHPLMLVARQVQEWKAHDKR
jgi:Fe-S oxidoreductase